MPKHVRITTPENVSIDYELAGLGSRGGAAIVDLALQGSMIVVITTVRYLLAHYGKWPGATWSSALLGIAIFVIIYGYYVYFEVVWNGQTPGKRLIRLRTVREGGMSIDLACAALRNLVRVVDFLPFMYGLGAVAILASSSNKRLGDYAAGTLVVKERPSLTDEAELVVGPKNNVGLVKNIELLTPDEFAAAKRFVERKAELQPEVCEDLARKIAHPIMERLQIEPKAVEQCAAFLEELVAKCIEERGMR